MHLRPGLCPGPRWESSQRSPRTLSEFKGEGREGKGKGEAWAEGWGRRGEGGKGKKGRGGKKMDRS